MDELMPPNDDTAPVARPIYCAVIDFTRCEAIDWMFAAAIVEHHLPSAKPLVIEAVKSLFVVSLYRLKQFRLGEILTAIDVEMPGAQLFDPAVIEDVQRLLPTIGMTWEELDEELLGRAAVK